MPDKEDPRQRRNRLAREAYQRRKAAKGVDGEKLSMSDQALPKNLGRRNTHAHLAPRNEVEPIPLFPEQKDKEDTRDDDELSPEELVERRKKQAQESDDPLLQAALLEHGQRERIIKQRDDALDRQLATVRLQYRPGMSPVEIKKVQEQEDAIIQTHMLSNYGLPPDPFDPVTITGMRKAADERRLQESGERRQVAESEAIYASKQPTKQLQRIAGSFKSARHNRGIVTRRIAETPEIGTIGSGIVRRPLPLEDQSTMLLPQGGAPATGIPDARETENKTLADFWDFDTQRIAPESHESQALPAFIDKGIHRPRNVGQQYGKAGGFQRVPVGPINRAGARGPKKLAPMPPMLAPIQPAPALNVGGAASPPAPPPPPTTTPAPPINVTLQQQKQRVGVPSMTLFGIGLALIFCNFLLQADPVNLVKFFTQAPHSVNDVKNQAILPAQMGVTLIGEILFLFIITELAALNGGLNALVTGFIGLMWLLWIVKNQQLVFGPASPLGNAFKVIFRQAGNVVVPPPPPDPLNPTQH